jgi:hypothetical protein
LFPEEFGDISPELDIAKRLSFFDCRIASGKLSPIEKAQLMHDRYKLLQEQKKMIK